MKRRFIILIIFVACAFVPSFAQTRRRPRPSKRPAARQQAPKVSAPKYSAFLHSSDKHKSLACGDCHKLPTAWTAKRDFPDVADFPDHAACVRCHRQQFFTRQAIVGSGPAICTVCHVRAAPGEDRRFAFGQPNISAQAMKPKDERQFVIEFPHDKHQNVIARLRGRLDVRLVPASFFRAGSDDEKKPDYNNCSICHQLNKNLAIATLSPAPTDASTFYPYKSMPDSHDSCFNCHWKNQKPVSDDCAGCHKASPALEMGRPLVPRRTSAKFAHEGGKGEHVMECTTCHINITRSSSLRGLTPDVPINACALCHRDSKKTTYPKAVKIETELEQFKKTGECTYCHTAEVGKKKPPPSHNAAVQ